MSNEHVKIFKKCKFNFICSQFNNKLCIFFISFNNWVSSSMPINKQMITLEPSILGQRCPSTCLWKCAADVIFFIEYISSGVVEQNLVKIKC